MDSFLILIVIAIIAIYFLPMIAAIGRDHRNTPAITILNAFLGWTFIGWVLALVWAFTDNTERRA